MDKCIFSGTDHYDKDAAMAAAHATKFYANAERISSKPKQQQQQQQTLLARRNSSPKLAATFQGMSVNVHHQQQQHRGVSSGVHSWPRVRHDELALQAAAAAASAAPRVRPMTATPTPPTTLNYKQYNNNSNGNGNGKIQKQPPALPVAEQISTGLTPSRTKPRNKSEEAINDLLQRIPDIGHIFDVQSRIGNGTFSTVLLATLKREAQLPDSMRRKFAIKHHIPTSHPERIMKELQCMTDMGGTDNVVGIHCCLRCEASAAFVMPYMPHDRFHDFYTKMDVPEIRMYMRNLLLALRHVHKFNIIHRDVKPSNFLYNRRQGQFLLVDFGLAQHVNLSGTAASLAAISQQQQQQQQLTSRSNASSGAINLANSKRPREREATTAYQQQQQQQQQQPAATPSEAALGGAVKRMRLIDESAASNWNKMPLKPVNEIAQHAKGGDDAKPGANDAGEAAAAATQQPAAQVQPQPQPQLQATQPEQSAGTSSKYNTNRAAGGSNGKCFCFGNPSVCINCLMKKEVHASRAGTPGYRPPEVLLKYADQTTAVDVWAAGVIFLSILSSVYPFFKAPNDFIALAEIVTIFGDRAIRKTALALERMVTISQRAKPLNLRKLCLRFRNRLIFSDQQMIRKHESADGRIDICKNCDQYSFNCLCEESEYATEPLDPYECFPASAYDLLGRLLEINPHSRISAEEALNHPFFAEQAVDSVPAAMMPRPEPAKQTPRRRNTKIGGGGGAAVAATAPLHLAALTAEQLPPTLHKL